MKLPELKIANFTASVPIIQGGMAIRISIGALAGAVAAAGAIGVIGASGMEDEELANEIKIAREKAKGRGVIGINIMFAARNFWGVVKAAAREKIDIIFTGAGFSRDIFKFGQDNNITIVPIVSSARLAKTSERCGAAAIVVEGTEAGGHLGTDRPIRDILPEVVEAVKLPVVAAGGITTGADIVDMLKLGASGVQIATRFVLSEECNAAMPYKKRYQTATQNDIVKISSPVGLPGRALKTAFVEKILKQEAPKPVGCDFCLKNCSLEYCIIQALIRSLHGDIENGVVFSGANVWKIKDRSIKPAAKIIEELVKEAQEVS
ncbi:2-nitropropane dioxygenase [Candidatus Saganbacteria bacterium CG08_land_8_20_14_0_20_45_16]|uniref:2-nitropropane dioxygenase n=1 Tax=Candidatus Saganbacteria bacterium CG08_land_8_20_14_0_20_45_16 TaxID=2014293 RepID=A0A2H0XYC1_UNCSA|nr:MAG: 2-nitropropane dioxygenase [Candidatus Saganbacteria bacterium CG08_land_8_20_14_0_20_45_16]